MHTLAAATVAAAVSAPAPAVAAPTDTTASETTATGTATSGRTAAGTTAPGTTATNTDQHTTAPPTSARHAEAWIQPTTDQVPAGGERTDPPRHPIPPSPPSPPPPAYLVGDSITDMHRAVIAPVLDACGADVHIHSLSARSIEQSYEWNGGWVNSGLDEIDRVLEVTDPVTWIIELGSNDLHHIQTADEAHRLIRAVLDRIGDDDDRVLWTTTLWPHYATATDIFNAALRATPGIELVEWHAVGGDHLADPVHPTDDGARILANLYCDALDRQHP